MASFTSGGEGMEGLPMEKSKTFSRPTTADCFRPYSNSSRIQERLEPNAYICAEIMGHTSFLMLGGADAPACGKLQAH